LIVIGLVGGPGSGKTTTALALTSALKRRGIEAEYVPEYARELSLDGKLSDAAQTDIFNEQLSRLVRYVGTGVRYVVTDSPMILQAAYASKPLHEIKALWAHRSFVHRLFVLERDRNEGEHSLVGREHTQEQSEELDKVLVKLLDDYGIQHQKISVCPDTVGTILEEITGY